MSIHRWTQVLLFCLLGTCALADISSIEELTSVSPDHDIFSLLPRQYDGSTCLLACDLETCGSSACPTSRKREEIPLHYPDHPYNFFNETTGDWRKVSGEEYKRLLAYRSLAKRVFAVNPRWNKVRAAAYLAGQWLNPPVDNTFAWSSGLVIPQSSGTVSVLQDFATSTSFQLVGAGLHGCTVLVVTSNRGVYMAHYWETYTTMGNDVITAGSVELQNWQNKVLNTIDGITGTRDPAAQGPTFDPLLFNQPGDNTMIHIMTPEEYVNNAWRLKYPQKTALIAQTIKNMLPNVKVAFTYKPYQRLNYWSLPGTNPVVYVGPDSNNINTSERGQALFQYDGAGNWRLFLEEVYDGN